MSEPYGIYIHIPFCLKKCVYCDFYSVAGGSPDQISGYIRALKTEIRLRLAAASKPDSVCQSIYFGGGTPSLVPASDISAVLDKIHSQTHLARDVEITLEANPGTLSPDKLRCYRDAGINRISIGIQSFDPDKLAFLGRVHSAGQGRTSAIQAKTAGFDNVCLDLMYGIPGETRASWEKDLASALELEPDHISCYMLTVEPGTPLAIQVQKDSLQMHDADRMADFFKQTSLALTGAGFRHYEISNFAKPGFMSRHNSAYWNALPYLGLGAGAHSFDRTCRTWNPSDIGLYVRALDSGALPEAEREILDERQKMLEMVMLRLRTDDGLEMRQFEAIFQRSFDQKFKALISELQGQGMAVIREGRFSLTLDGRIRINSIVEAFAEEILAL